MCRFSRHLLGRLRWAVVHRPGQVKREQWLRLRLLPVSLPRCRRARARAYEQDGKSKPDFLTADLQ